ncbi:hypothetical protein DICVIV_04619 [Dictyocaulus viviparus]|uniref:ShKT domain-containing protein n=1 Tax=Dictyocaulus viviparus TaxID=29172 RepID=A0A0D8XZR8_DICVI|nr:hypothetical protein DICVIV_04619 [Dictyocaulus viviparus]
MRLTSLAVLLVVDVTTSDIIRRAILDCQRIDESFCCTSRVRNHCAEQCKSVQCDIIKKVESTDEEIKMEQFASGTDIGSRFSMEPIRSNPHPHDGSAQLSSSSVTTVLPPSTPIPFSMMSFTQTPFTQSPIPLTPFNGFPTLIPFQPNIDSLPDIEGSEQQSTDIPVVHSTIVKSIHHRVRTTPDPRIITPPESLVVIGEYDEETTTESYRQSTITFSTAEEVNAIVIPRTMNNTINNLNTSSNMVIIKPKESENNNQQQRTRGDSSGWTQKRFCSLTANPQRCYKRMLEMKRRKVEQLRTFDTTTASLSLPNHRSSRERLLRLVCRMISVACERLNYHYQTTPTSSTTVITSPERNSLLEMHHLR